MLRKGKGGVGADRPVSLGLQPLAVAVLDHERRHQSEDSSWAPGPPAQAPLAWLQRFAQGYPNVYLVGGFLRDIALAEGGGLGRIEEIDCAVQGAEKCARAFAKTVQGRVVSLDPRVWRVVVGKPGPTWVDFTELRAKDIEADLRGRDFGVNALACPLPLEVNGEGRLIDPCGGLDDLATRTIRAVSPSTIQEDPIRALRAFRLAAQWTLTLEAQTETLLMREGYLISRSAPERIREEGFRLLRLPSATPAVRRMADVGLLFTLLPECETMRGIAQEDSRGIHAGDLLSHSLDTLEVLESLLREAEGGAPGRPAYEDLFSGHGRRLSRYLRPVFRIPVLKLAALLHDMGKPRCREVGADGKIHFYGHEEVGAEMADSLAKRLRFSRRERECLRGLVRQHMRLALLMVSFEGKPVSRRAVFRLGRDAGEDLAGLVFLGSADARAKGGPLAPGEVFMGFARGFLEVSEEVFGPSTDRGATPSRWINGHDLQKLFKLAPGPRLGAILSGLEEAQGAGEVSCREEALAWIERLLKRGEKSGESVANQAEGA